VVHTAEEAAGRSVSGVVCLEFNRIDSFETYHSVVSVGTIPTVGFYLLFSSSERPAIERTR